MSELASERVSSHRVERHSEGAEEPALLELLRLLFEENAECAAAPCCILLMNRHNWQTHQHHLSSRTKSSMTLSRALPRTWWSMAVLTSLLTERPWSRKVRALRLSSSTVLPAGAAVTLNSTTSASSFSNLRTATTDSDSRAAPPSRVMKNGDWCAVLVHISADLAEWASVACAAVFAVISLCPSRVGALTWREPRGIDVAIVQPG